MEKAEIADKLRMIEDAAYEIEKLLKGGPECTPIDVRRYDVSMSYYTATAVAEQLAAIESISTSLQREMKDA